MEPLLFFFSFLGVYPEDFLALYFPTSMAIRMAIYMGPIMLNRIARDRAWGLIGVISPYPRVVMVTKL